MKKGTAFLLTLVLVLPLAMPAFAQTVTFGYYNDEPLTWLVLSWEPNYTKLISEQAIACRPFGESSEWESSSLRSWLNDSFICSAFSAGERNALARQGNDLIRLASVGDMMNPNYGFSTNRDAKDSSRAARGSGTAIGEGLWTNDYGCCSYYTLTPYDKNSLFQVRSDGSIGIARYDRENVGVRPVIVVDTSMLR